MEATQDTRPPPGPIGLALGDEIEIAGLRCKLTYVNEGQRRLTFTLLDEDVRLRRPSRDPIVGIVR